MLWKYSEYSTWQVQGNVFCITDSMLLVRKNCCTNSSVTADSRHLIVAWRHYNIYFLWFVACRVHPQISCWLHWRRVWYATAVHQIACIFILKNKSHIGTGNYQYDSNQNIFGTFHGIDYITKRVGSFPRQFATNHNCLPLLIVCDCSLACFTQYRNNAYLLSGYIYVYLHCFLKYTCIPEKRRSLSCVVDTRIPFWTYINRKEIYNELFRTRLDPGLCFIYDRLTHWRREPHICVNKLTIIGSDNGLLPRRCQAIIWTNARNDMKQLCRCTLLCNSLEYISFPHIKCHFLDRTDGIWQKHCCAIPDFIN